MPVQTRARGQPAADTSSPSKVYKAKPAAPKQQHFPPRRRQIKTYGRRRPRKPDPGQGTLTQMDFIASLAHEDAAGLVDDDDSDDIIDNDGDSEDDDGINSNEERNSTRDPDEGPRTGRARKMATQKKPARSSRRRTTGDVLDVLDDEATSRKRRRRTLGDTPSASSRFHTQTLTQFMSNAKTEHEDNWKIPESEADDGEFAVVRETPKKPAEHIPSGPTVPAGPEAGTPTTRRTKMEIPSSESPGTPLLLARYSPAKQQSPLVAKSTNTSAPPPTLRSTGKTRTLVIEDTYSTTHSSPVTPTPKARTKALVQVTPAKRLRFDLPDDKENITPGRTKPKSPRPTPKPAPMRQPLREREVPDSDQELETEDEETDSDAAAESSQGRSRACESEEIDIPRDDDDDDDNDDDEDARYPVGEETQAILTSAACRSGREASYDTPEIMSDITADAHDEEYRNCAAKSDDLFEQPDKGEVMEQSPVTTPTPASAQRDRGSKEADVTTQADSLLTQGCTQGLESQRVPLETIRSTGPISDRSDIIVSISSEHVKSMATRAKTHEFRDWRIPDYVCRVWVYSTKPANELRYMCILGSARTPGQIHEDGAGNAEFNRELGKARFAYEILQMYELNNPVSYETMKDHGWPVAPQKLAYVAPAIVGQLTANLRCPLWGDEAHSDLVPSSSAAGPSSVTESQELADQIRSDINHAATQFGPSDQPEIIPSSPPASRPAARGTTPRDDAVFARPAPPKTQSASSTRSLPRSQNLTGRAPVRPSQASTISQLSSSPIRTPRTTSRVRVPENTSSPTTQTRRNGSLRSSQLLSKSQMLPDSLINDDIQEPPPIIWDSADEASE